MLYINKNSENYLAVTAGQTTDRIYFTFQLQNQSTNNISYFCAEDISTNTALYNEFLIIETGTTYVNLTSGIINLRKGYYDYAIFSADAQHLMVTGSCLEKGILIVSGDSTTVNSYSQGQLDGYGRTKKYLGKI